MARSAKPPEERSDEGGHRAGTAAADEMKCERESGAIYCRSRGAAIFTAGSS
jgi:hypothetical protein